MARILSTQPADYDTVADLVTAQKRMHLRLINNAPAAHDRSWFVISYMDGTTDRVCISLNAAIYLENRGYAIELEGVLGE